MSSVDRIVLLLIAVALPFCGWCQSKASSINRLRSEHVTALLNNSHWQGKAFGVRDSWQDKNKKYRASDWFGASFVTYSPRVTNLPKKVITDSLTQLVVSQWLHVSHIPIAVGRYHLSDSTQENLRLKVRYDILEGGDAISDSYYPSQNFDNWIQIIKYDLKSEIITGTFNLKLVNQTNEVAHFKSGIFKIRMVYEFYVAE